MKHEKYWAVQFFLDILSPEAKEKGNIIKETKNILGIYLGIHPMLDGYTALAIYETKLDAELARNEIIANNIDCIWSIREVEEDIESIIKPPKE